MTTKKQISVQTAPGMTDTIAAIATAPGAGGIGVVRLSGPLALTLLAAVFRPASRNVAAFIPRTLYFGHVIDANKRDIDEALAVYFPGPHSFTGEDVAEIQGHGGSAVLNAVLEAILDAGAAMTAADQGRTRLAERGEFTRRAFLNGKMDLTQAEAVAELVAAPSMEGVRLASAKLEGMLGRQVSALRDRLEYLRQRVCLAVDFPDEEAECLPPAEFRAVTQEVRDGVAGLLAGYQRARCWSEGALVVLAGRVNAGKSSLMNALLGRPRAIVTERPGTTRDYLEEQTSLAGLPVRLVDTAGLRIDNTAEALDPIESEGIRRGRKLMDAAQAVLVVLDGGAFAAATPPADASANNSAEASAAAPATAFGARGVHPAKPEEWKLIRELGPERCILVWNKADIAPCPSAWREAPGLLPCRLTEASARTGQGLDLLAGAVREICAAQAPQAEEIAPNLRQARALQQALTELDLLDKDIAAAVPPDLCGLRLETAAAFLADVTGLNSAEDTLNAIFADFCIGK